MADFIFGRAVTARYSFENVCNIDLVEAWAVWHAVLSAKDSGFDRVILASDCLSSFKGWQMYTSREGLSSHHSCSTSTVLFWHKNAPDYI